MFFLPTVGVHLDRLKLTMTIPLLFGRVTFFTPRRWKVGPPRGTERARWTPKRGKTRNVGGPDRWGRRPSVRFGAEDCTLEVSLAACWRMSQPQLFCFVVSTTSLAEIARSEVDASSNHQRGSGVTLYFALRTAHHRMGSPYNSYNIGVPYDFDYHPEGSSSEIQPGVS